MKNNKMSILLLLILLFLYVYLEVITSIILTLLTIVICFRLERYHKFYKELNYLYLLNISNLSKEKNLQKIFQLETTSFITSCKILESKAKSKIERRFFLDLAKCNSKKQINHLLKIYIDKFQWNYLWQIIDTIILVILEIVIISIYQSENKFDDLFVVCNFLYSILLLIEVNSILSENDYKCSYENCFRYFYYNLYYLSPMLSLKTTIERFKLKDSIFNHIYLLVSNGDIESQIFDDDKNQLINQEIYKLCLKNHYECNPVIDKYYQNIKNKQNNYLINIRIITETLVFILFLYIGVKL